MAGTIQIKRSANTATPTTLEFGEVAWSSNGGTLHIGREDGNKLFIGDISFYKIYSLFFYKLFVYF